jgi:hypothetical protein
MSGFVGVAHARPLSRVREILDYPKRDNLNAERTYGSQQCYDSKPASRWTRDFCLRDLARSKSLDYQPKGGMRTPEKLGSLIRRRARSQRTA